MWHAILIFIIISLLADKYNLQPSDFIHPFQTDKESVSFSDNELFWTVCSRYFVSDRIILAVTLQSSTYAVRDFASVVLQEMYNHLTTPITIMGHKRSSVDLRCRERISLRQIINNKSRDDLISKHQYRTRKDSCVHVANISTNNQTGTNASRNRRQSKHTVGNSNLQNKATRPYKRRPKRHTVSPTHKSALQNIDLPMCKYRFAEHNNTNTQDASTCYQPINPTAVQSEIMRSLHISCHNYLIIAENENSVARYFSYLTNINIKWNSEIKFILLLVKVGYGSTTEFKFRCRSLLQQLWDRFKVTNVIIMTVSKIQNRYAMSGKVIVYNPFIPISQSVSRGRIFAVNVSASELFKKHNPKFYGYPLRVAMFQRFPTVVSNADCHLDDKNCTVTYTGMDASLLYTLATYLNFTPVIRQPSDGEQYGYRTQNGTFTGAIGDIVYGRADIFMNGIFIKVYGSDKVTFTHIAYSDMVCVIVPKAKRIPKWLTIFGPVDSTVALGVLGLYAISVCFGYLTNRVRSCFESSPSNSKTSLSAILTEMLRPFVSSPFPRIPLHISHRIFLGSCLVFGLVLTSAMQSMLVTAMTKPYYYPDINSLEELDASGLSIYTKSPSLMDTFGSPQINNTVTCDINPTTDRLSTRVQLVASNINMWGVISTDRNIAGLARRTDYAYGLLLDKYRTSDGSLLLHVVRECPRDYFLGYLMPRGSPYLSYINDGIARLVEAGIVEHWKQTTPSTADMQDIYEAENLTDVADITNENPKVFSLKDLQIAFYILAVGLSGSVILFLLEIMCKKK